MSKYKIIKQKYTPADTEVPEPVRNNIWVGKLSDDDTVDIFTYLSDAEYFRAQLEAADPTGRKYKVIKI